MNFAANNAFRRQISRALLTIGTGLKAWTDLQESVNDCGGQFAENEDVYRDVIEG